MDSKEAANAKRRRGIGLVTANACTECRKKRSKCDGDDPCGRCRSTSSDCVYEVPVRQSKETMRLEIESLRQDQQQHQRIMAALVSDDKETHSVLTQLRNGETIENIAVSLDAGTSYIHQGDNNMSNMMTTIAGDSQQAIASALKPATDMSATGWPFTSEQGSSSREQPDGDSMNWTADTSVKSYMGAPSESMMGSWHQDFVPISSPDSTTSRARSYGQERILGSTYGWEERSDTYHPNVNQQWTTVTNDGRFVEHIMALYFCWEYPTFASLSKEHFLKDFREGTNVRCSSLLVNALLALGCRFSDHPDARTDPERSDTAGDHFFKEASRLLNEDPEHHILTTVQALGLMSIREASCGRTSQAIYHSGQSISLALEMGLHMLKAFDADDSASQTENAVRAATFWGAFSLDQSISLSIGRLPHFSRKLNVIAKPQIQDTTESAPWVPYTDNGVPLKEICTQPSNVRSVYQTFCELSEFVHRGLYACYSPGKSVTSHGLYAIYHDYCKWYEEIPVVLRLGQNFTPAVLFAHMYYHYAILLLLRPFIKLELAGWQETPRDICCQAADAISSLVKSYSNLYTLKRTPSFVPYFVLTSSITHVVAFGNSRGSIDKVRQGISDLKEMTSCHGFASRALDILYFLLDHWKIDFKLQGPEANYDFKNMCRPDPASANLFCPNFAMGDVMDDMGPGDRENPMFWPFPLQGRPVMDISALSANGFKMLSP